jgi:negative regulator of flagellin synthesis FlgM
MNIKNIPNTVSNPAQADAQKKVDLATQHQAKDTATKAPAASADKVTLTATTQQAKSLEKKMDEARVDNSEKIKALKLAIENGEYEVDTDSVAKKLLQTEFAFARKSAV